MSKPGDSTPFTIQSYSIKELKNAYKVSYDTFQAWVKPIVADLGPYKGKRYTPAQVEKIVKHLGLPEYSI